MVVDVGVVKNHIKPKADSTLYNMRKVDLIEYVRTLEHNYNVAVSFNENQAKYIESLDVVEVRCADCKHYSFIPYLDKAPRCTKLCVLHNKAYEPKPDDFCSRGERSEGE